MIDTHYTRNTAGEVVSFNPIDRLHLYTGIESKLHFYTNIETGDIFFIVKKENNG